MNKFLKIALGLSIIFLVLFLVIVGKKEKSNSEELLNNSPEPQVVESKSSELPDYSDMYQIKVNRDRGNVINYKLLISPDDVVVAEELATNFFKKCTKNCTVDIYDDERALNFHETLDQMYMKSETTQEDLNKWERKNYVFVADHNVGRIDFDAQMYNDYPLKDSQYRELGGKN